MEAAELALRLRAESLIAGFADLGIEGGMAALADVESVAVALAAVGVMDVEAAAGLVADTVDALVVRRAAWVEPMAVDLDVRRLYDLAAGAPRPRLRRVVPVGSGSLTTIDLWDDGAEARTVVGGGAVGPSLHLDAIPASDVLLELADEDGGMLAVDLSQGRAGSDGGSSRRIERAEYLVRLEADAAGRARRDPSVDVLNGERRRVEVVAAALFDASTAAAAVARYDEVVARIDAGRGAAPMLVELVPVAVRTTAGWLLSLERWGDHWRAVVRAEGRGAWSAVDDHGAHFGGDLVSGDVVRFDPALPPTWSWVRLSRLAADGTVVEVDVVRP